MNKKLISAVCSIFTAFTLAACGGSGAGASGAGGKSVTLRINAFNGGYGTDYLVQMGNAFSAINKNVKVVVKQTVDTPSDIAKIEAGTYVSDILVHTTLVNSRGMKGQYLSLNEVYDSELVGEDKTVAEKLGENANQFLYYDGNYYALPVSDGMTSMIYNKTTLDEAFGEGNWSLPRTTDELYALCTSLINKEGYYPFVYTIDTEGEYQYWMTYTFLAQLMGIEEYYKAMEGYVKDDAGEYAFDVDGGRLYNLEEKELALKETQRFNGWTNGMASKWCDSMNFSEAQALFLGHGYGSRERGKAAFMTNGDWIYNEMKFLISDDNPQDIRMMKMPVSSEIVNYTDTIGDDRELAALIEAIDNGSESLTGEGYDVSQADYDRIAEARGVIFSLMTQQIACIPSNCRQPVLAKKFLAFIASSTGCQIYSKALEGDCSPYDRSLQQGVTPNTFIQSKLDILSRPYTYVLSMPSLTKFAISYFPSFYYFSQKLHEGKILDDYKSETYKRTFTSAYVSAKQAAGLMG